MGKDIATFGDSDLTFRDKTTKVKNLWNDKPAVILAIRRPGCVLCRAQAQKLWNEKAKFDDLGFNIVCVLHEWMEREVKAFTPTFWAGDVWLDQDKVIYKNIHGGQLKKGSIFAMLNPFSKAWKNIRRAQKEVKDHNMTGDGMTMGGILVVAKNGQVLGRFPEETFGDYVSMFKLFEVCKQAQ